ncbi:GTPase IMAP family member 4-like [Alosa sapidissima]|uniref:GTPase IMAP family member 4-like n=1 Tax=Alosa sapidissima TaxID=34773 RepID=UPI001C08F960|nr:GTPase IMAP family member 4-like [Alosa sapidissima]
MELDNLKRELKEKDKVIHDKDVALQVIAHELSETKKALLAKTREVQELEMLISNSKKEDPRQSSADPDSISNHPARKTRSMGIPPWMGGESPSEASSASPVVPELRLVLLGKRAEAKRAVAEAILGRDMVVMPVSTPTQAQCSVSRQGEVVGRKVTVVDTPDWFSPAFSEKLRQDVRLCMKLSNPGPHVFLLVIAVDTLEGEERNIPDKMEDIFGETCWEHTVILFTSTDRMRETSVEELIQRGNLELLVERSENKYHLLDSKACGAIESLLRKIEAVVTRNPDGFYSSQMYLEAEELFRELQEKKEEREERRKIVENEKAQQLDKTLQDSLRKVEEEIRGHEGEIRALRESMSALERKIEEEQDERKIRELEGELKREADQREQLEKKMSELKENSEKERKEMEAKYKMEIEELRETHKREVKAEKEKQLMKITLHGFRKWTSLRKPIMEKHLISDRQQLPMKKDVIEGESERLQKQIEKMCMDITNLSQALMKVRNSAEIHVKTEE